MWWAPLLNTIAGLLSGGVVDTTAYESIATTTVGGGGAATVSFTSIPATYTHLQIRGISRSTATGTGTEASLITFNSDSGTNYSYHTLRGDGSSATATGSASTTFMVFWGSVRAGDTASVFGGSVVDILDYANTNKYKTLRALGGIDTNTTVDYIVLSSGNWRSTSAVTGITIACGAGNFAQYSQFALYGIKGA
jgi:hypothetical protein